MFCTAKLANEVRIRGRIRRRNGQFYATFSEDMHAITGLLAAVDLMQVCSEEKTTSWPLGSTTAHHSLHAQPS